VPSIAGRRDAAGPPLLPPPPRRPRPPTAPSPPPSPQPDGGAGGVGLCGGRRCGAAAAADAHALRGVGAEPGGGAGTRPARQVRRVERAYQLDSFGPTRKAAWTERICWAGFRPSERLQRVVASGTLGPRASRAEPWARTLRCCRGQKSTLSLSLLLAVVGQRREEEIQGGRASLSRPPSPDPGPRVPQRSTRGTAACSSGLRACTLHNRHRGGSLTAAAWFAPCSAYRIAGLMCACPACTASTHKALLTHAIVREQGVCCMNCPSAGQSTAGP
jgi:hypothetical protein